MELLEPPRVVDRAKADSLGIRVVTPFRGMLRVRDELLAELDAWLQAHGIEPEGPFFHRLHVIDMDGPMDMEVGVVTAAPADGDDRVRRTELPSGRYATLTYRMHARRANKALLDWAYEQGLALDRSDVAEGDRFACRYEAYRTDPRTEPRKTQWIAELNIRLVDG